MKIRFLLLTYLLGFICLITSNIFCEETIILPKPKYIKYKTGDFRITDDVKIVFASTGGDKLENIAKDLKKHIFDITGFDLNITELANIKDRTEKMLLITTNNSSLPEMFLPKEMEDIKLNELGKEGYLLEISENAVFCGVDEAGAFYAVQSFLQMLKYEHNAWSVPYSRIIDEPHFSIRGQHFDPARQFRNVELLKRYIEILARYKMNTIHIHFTDDQAWTLESKKYKLTVPGKFYTQDELNEIVSFAEQHFITVIPEIDMPGHCRALRKAYPELACQSSGKKRSSVICPGNEETYKFLEDIFAEFCPIFKGPYFHVGADEVETHEWQNCPICSKRISDENLSDEKELYFYFLKRVQEMLIKYNKKMVIWWEYFPQLDKWLDKDNTILQEWRGKAKENSVKEEFKIINSQWFPLYLSHNTSTPKEILEFNPVITKDIPENTLGIISCSWGDRKELTEDIVLLPRILAVAEKSWTDKTDSKEFNMRMAYHFLNILNQIPDKQQGKLDKKYINKCLKDITTDPKSNLASFKENIIKYIISQQ
ncbi:MAG: family 20 glycosylhydrolase [Elusimicrobia bacterium]|nr:family 20 glycosylhydrolase [Elusimicrobiota bacterium]